MIEYATLGFTTWQLFACLRVVMWGSLSSEYLNDITTCETVKETALIKYCNTERELDWTVYCKSLSDQGFKIDCDNANKLAKSEIQNRLAKSSGSNQWRCVHR